MRTYKEESLRAKAVKEGIVEPRPKIQKAKDKSPRPYKVVWEPSFTLHIRGMRAHYGVSKCRRLEEAVKQCDKYRRAHSGRSWIEGPDVPLEYQRPET